MLRQRGGSPSTLIMPQATARIVSDAHTNAAGTEHELQVAAGAFALPRRPQLPKQRGSPGPLPPRSPPAISLRDHCPASSVQRSWQYGVE